MNSALLAFFGQMSQPSPHPELLHAMNHEGDDVGTWTMWTPDDLEAVRYFRSVRFVAPEGHARESANGREITQEEVLTALAEGRVAGPFPGGDKAGSKKPGPPFVRWGRYEPDGPNGPLVIVYQYQEFVA